MRKKNITIILGKKLHAIRLWKAMSQTKMLLLVIPEEIKDNRSRVSEWERGTREPPREALIRYSRFAEISLEILLDDEQHLPAHIKTAVKRENLRGDGKQHKQSIIRNDAAEEKSSLPNVKHETTLPAQAISGETDPDSLEACADCKAPAAEIRPYHDELLNLSLLSEEESKERAIFGLPAPTLDRVHRMHLQLQLRTPRFARSSLTVDGIVDLALNLVLYNYDQIGDESLVVKQLQAMIKQLSGNRKEFSLPGKAGKKKSMKIKKRLKLRKKY